MSIRKDKNFSTKTFHKVGRPYKLPFNMYLIVVGFLETKITLSTINTFGNRMNTLNTCYTWDNRNTIDDWDTKDTLNFISVRLRNFKDGGS